MAENNSPIYIIENQNEENVDQILNLKNESLCEKNMENELSEKYNILEPQNVKEEIQYHSKGYVRLLRNIIKKKDDSRKKILQKHFYEWKKQFLKGLTIKKTILVRISISKGKENKDKINKNLDNPKEKETTNINKYEPKTYNKISHIPKNLNIIKNSKKDNNNIKLNNNKKENKLINNTYLDNKNSNNISYEIGKNIKGYKGKTDEKEIINISLSKNTNSIINSISQDNISKKISNRNQITNKNSSKQINISKITNNDKTNNIIFPINNENIRYTEIRSSCKNKSIKPNNNLEIKKVQRVEKIGDKSNSKINNIPTQKLNYNNVSIIFTSSTKKNKNFAPLNNTNNISHLKEDNKLKNNLKINNQNIIKDLPKKYEYYDRKKYSTLEPNSNRLDLKEKIKNEYYPYESNKKKIIERKVSDKSFSKGNITDYNIYRRSNYKRENNKNISQNNEIDIKVKNPRRSNWMYSQTTFQPSIKGGTTTVIQHFSGRKNQYDHNSQS